MVGIAKHLRNAAAVDLVCLNYLLQNMTKIVLEEVAKELKLIVQVLVVMVNIQQSLAVKNFVTTVNDCWLVAILNAVTLNCLISPFWLIVFSPVAVK